MSIETQHPDYDKYINKWRDCRTFYEGEDEVKANTTRYLPKPAAASDDEYIKYLERAYFYGAVEPTVNGLGGAVFRKSPTVELSTKSQHLEMNADAENSSLSQFARGCLDECLLLGRVGILVDRPQNGGLPYLTMFTAENITNWTYNANDGLTRVVLRETYYKEKPDEPTEQDLKTRYRELRLVDGTYQQIIYEQNEDESTYYALAQIAPTKSGKPLDTIPFVFCNVKSTSPTIDKPPLLELVRKNNEHYRVGADYANIVYYTGQPILWVRGVDAEEVSNLKIGSSYAFLLPNEGSSLGYLEVSSGGVTPIKERYNDIKVEMAVLGAKLLEGQRVGVEAAETAQLRQNAEMSKLMNVVLSVSQSLTKALQYADTWEGGSGEKIKYQLNTDFIDVVMNPSVLSTLAGLVEKEFISWDTFFYNLAIGELLPPGRTAEEERALIESQPPVNPIVDLIQQASLTKRV